jgi:hypothetical protein
MKTMIGMLVACCLATACSAGDPVSTVCEKEAQCATKAGVAFSKTQCEDQLTQVSEKAQTAGCSDEYQTAADCVAGAVNAASCTDLETDLSGYLQSECGAEIKKLNTCLQ